MATLNCYPPHPAWEQLRTALVGAFASAGADICLALSLYAIARHAGLADVQYRPFLLCVRSSDAWVDYLPATVESLRRTIVERKLMTDDRSRRRWRPPRAPAQSRRGVHVLHGRPGVGRTMRRDLAMLRNDQRRAGQIGFCTASANMSTPARLEPFHMSTSTSVATALRSPCAAPCPARAASSRAGSQARRQDCGSHDPRYAGRRSRWLYQPRV
jgi:hypothetical protein